MAGNRILDVVALARASRKVAQQHFRIRGQQLDLYLKTSSIVKGFASSPSPQFTNSQTVNRPTDQDKPVPQTTSKEEAPSPSSALDQDHSYDPSHSEIKPNQSATESLHVEQKQADHKPLPDGNIPASDSVAVPDEAGSKASRIAQRVSEDQIPREVARQNIESDLKQQGHDQDTFSEVSHDITTPLSSIPREKFPHNTGTDQGDVPGLEGKGLNQDVYTDPAAHTGTKPETTNPDDADLAKLFHNPRIAKRLLNKDEKTGGPRGSRSYSTQSPKDPKNDSLRANTNQSRSTMRESSVPSSRLGRMWEYGGLATSMVFGAASESLRRAAGSSTSQNPSLILSNENIERLVVKLSRMRGAALKLGQMISFQDSKMLPPAIHKVLQRVQDSADYMPARQRNAVMTHALGENWRSLFSEFEEIPMAAASIGQVHGAVLSSTGMPVAVKIQYPGVARSIDSDLNNISMLLTASSLLPKGLYLDKTIANARIELGWECDYIREAQAAKKFQELLADDADVFTVPKIIESASSGQVLTMERMSGVGVAKMQTLSQEQKDWIGSQILRLCLREITEFKYMQTDPNWTNFLFNESTNKLELLDFGASREYPEEFIQNYTKVLLAASKGDKETCKDLSVKLGYLTGMESRTMLEAHIASMLTLAEPFRDSSPEVYDFQDQTITDRVRALIPTMVRERLAPPPEETYSLHRKLSGAFLLCAKLGSRVRCRDLFRNAMTKVGLV